MSVPSSEWVPPPAPSPASECVCVSPLGPKGGEQHSLAGEGVGGPNEGTDSLVLCMLCVATIFIDYNFASIATVYISYIPAPFLNIFSWDVIFQKLYLSFVLLFHFSEGYAMHVLYCKKPYKLKTTWMLPETVSLNWKANEKSPFPKRQFFHQCSAEQLLKS